MVRLTVEVEEESFDQALLEELTISYYTVKSQQTSWDTDGELLAALKRVIEYYGGSGDNE